MIVSVVENGSIAGSMSGRKVEIFQPTTAESTQMPPPSAPTATGKRQAPQPPLSDEESEKRPHREPPTESEPSDDETDDDRASLTTEPSPSTANSPPTALTKPSISTDGLKLFLDALSTEGHLRSYLMQRITGPNYYNCRGLWLQHHHGDFTDSKARQYNVKSTKEKVAWENIKGKVRQDAFAELLPRFNSLNQGA